VNYKQSTTQIYFGGYDGNVIKQGGNSNDGYGLKWFPYSTSRAIKVDSVAFVNQSAPSQNNDVIIDIFNNWIEVSSNDYLGYVNQLSTISTVNCTYLDFCFVEGKCSDSLSILPPI
jgi:hypothetical protein